jgi:hypothetical protein
MTAQQAGGWHAGDVALQEFCDGTVGPVMGASVETHLMQCAPCRSRLTAITPREPLDQVWLAIRETIEPDPPSVVERLLGRVGLSGESVRLLAAVPALRGAWLLGMSAALLFSAVAAVFGGTLGLSLFVLVAPLAPVLGVAAAYGGDADPSHAIVTITPYSAGRLLCLRTAAVLVSTVPAAALAGLVLPGPTWLALAWLGPAAAGIAIALLAAPFVGMTVASSTIAVGWSFAVVAATRLHEPLVLVDPAMQAVCYSLTAVGTAVLLLRVRTLDLPGRQS